VAVCVLAIRTVREKGRKRKVHGIDLTSRLAGKTGILRLSGPKKNGV